MKRWITLLVLLGTFGLASPVLAQDQPAVAPVATAPAETAAPAVVAAPAVAPTAAAPAAAAPVPNKGDVSWMLVSTLLVIMMAVPGLALFYGGLVRTKNTLSVLMQVMVTFSLIVVLWAIYGYGICTDEADTGEAASEDNFFQLGHGVTVFSDAKSTEFTNLVDTLIRLIPANIVSINPAAIFLNSCTYNVYVRMTCIFMFVN